MLRNYTTLPSEDKGRKATDTDFWAYVVPAGSTYAGYLQVSSDPMQVSQVASSNFKVLGTA